MKRDILAEGKYWQQVYKELGGRYICPECGEVLKESQLQNTSGSMGCLILIILFITIIGIILIPFLMGNKKHGCPKCGSKTVVRMDSPKGKLLLKQYYPETFKIVENL